MEIEVFSDIVCPWCYVGMARLERALLALGSPPVTLRYRPFMLQPDAPDEGIDVAAMLRQRYGAEPRQLFARVEAEARASGIELDLTRQPRGYPTARAHTLLRHALPRGTQPALARALFEANFMAGADIADVEVLAGLAAAHGFEAAEARRVVSDGAELEATHVEAALARRRGIRGVPFYIIAGAETLSGAQPEQVFREVLARAAAA